MRKSSAYYWIIGVTLAAVASLLCGYAANRPSLETPVAVTLTQAVPGSIRQTLNLAGTVTYADQHYAIASQSGVAVWVTPKGEGESLRRGEALVRLDTTLPSQLLAQALIDPFPTFSSTLPSEAADMLNQLNSSVPQLEKAIDQSTIRTHAAGQVLQTLVHPGELVQSGSPVALLASTTPQIVTSLTTGQRQQVRIGAPAHIYQNGHKIAEGSVASITSSLTSDAATLPAAQMTLTLNHPPALQMGDPVEVRVLLQEAENIPTVPLTALDEQGYAWQVVDGRAWCMPGETLIWDAQQAWVQGITLQTTVILHPSGLVNGQRVKEALP